MKKYSEFIQIIIPCFNEGMNIADLDETELVILEKPTQGQAHTAKFALDNIDNLPGPVTFFLVIT